MQPKSAKIKLLDPDWSGVLPYLILRAAHYLYDYCGVSQLYLGCTEVPQTVREFWDAPLRLRKKNIAIYCDPNYDSSCPIFCSPDFMMRTANADIPLGIPEIPELTDFHIHTKLAYCSENMDVAKVLELERLSGVSHINFSEHSGQLYSSESTYWSNGFLWCNRQLCDDRTAEYGRLIGESPKALYGLELDVDDNAVVSDFKSPLLNGYRIGAVHFLAKDLSYNEQKSDFLRKLDALLLSRIDILAHPFRVFVRKSLPMPEDLFEPVAERLVRANVAAEINFHTNYPQAEFINLLLKKGGKLSWGSDSHNLYEAGYFRPHYDFCKELGIAGKLDAYLIHHNS
ncbi:MAG: hypothetical protein LBM70_08350 [Victivallales bacterium]|jgi:histidinol phosphatase-like PHP family hydrolase|nr:hypothetical protein [Victivallales bacterium]